MQGLWDLRMSWLYPYMQKSSQKRKGGQIRFIFAFKNNNATANDQSLETKQMTRTFNPRELERCVTADFTLLHHI